MMMRAATLAVMAALLLACAVPSRPARAASPCACDDVAGLVATLLPAVVNISVVRHRPALDANGNPLAKGATVRKTAAGSGFIIDADGLMLTNGHVVDGADEITVVLYDGMHLRAALIYRSPDLDLAMLRVHSPHELQAIRWGDSSLMRPGMPVLAIGNPLGLGFTVTAGIVSARNRDVRDQDLKRGTRETAADSYIQTDAAINPGNSGGPLFNHAGEVIGMNTALFTANGGGDGSVGLGLAIPSDDVQFITGSLRRYGHVRLGFLGVAAEDLSQEMALAAGLARPSGVIVTTVAPGSPADAAHLAVGDIVLRVGTLDIADIGGLDRAVRGSLIGAVKVVAIRRGDAEMSVSVRIGEARSDPANRLIEQPNLDPARLLRPDLGLTGATLNAALRRKFSIAAGIDGFVVTAVMPGTVGAEQGFAPGDTIMRIQQTAVTSLDAIEKAVLAARAQGRRYVLVLKVDLEGVRWLALPVPPVS